MFRNIEKSSLRCSKLVVVMLAMAAALLLTPLLAADNAMGAVKWRHGIPAAKIMELAFRQMALEKGFFKKEGLDVEFVLIPSGTTILQALIAGDLNSAELGSSPIYPAIEKGAALKIVGAFFPGANYAIFAKKDVKKLPDLYGKAVGTGAPGALLHMMAVAVLIENGLDSAKVQFVNIGSSAEVFRALLVGKIDAGVTLSTYQPEVDKKPDLHLLALIPEQLPKFLRLAMVASDKTIKDRGELLTKFMVAYAQGHRYALEHKDETVKLASKLTGREAEKMAWEFDWYIKNKVYDPDFGVMPEQIKFMQELSVKSKAQQKILPFEKIVNLDVRKKVLGIIGQYKKP